jgi:hypothetical protein
MSKYRKTAYGAMSLCLVAVAYAADNPFNTSKEFSATVVMESMPGSAPHGQAGQGNMKIYRSGDKMRTDLGGMGYMIIDMTQHTNYMVMNGMCMQMTAPQQQNVFAQAHDATVDRSPAGTDTVDGHACKVENVTVTSSNGKISKMKVWEAQDLKGFPVKIEMETARGPAVMQYKDVSLSAPDASLFVHPDNCSAMPHMPGAPPGAPPQQ